MSLDRRIFSRWLKEACWSKATELPGRDPNRWRLDAAGNPVCKQLRGCLGCLCHEYDHIVPFSRGGLTTLENCQILQTRVNRYKGNADDVPYGQLRSWSCSYQFNQQELDVVEMAVYGDIKRPGRSCRCKSFFELTDGKGNVDNNCLHSAPADNSNNKSPIR